MNPAVGQIKDRLTIEEVVSWYVALTPAGRHLRGKSPFNEEKTPSFFVSPDKGLFYCFSTGKGGDMFTFIQEAEGVDFKEALRTLADRAGVTLDTTQYKEASKLAKQKQLLQEVNRWYQVKLRRNEAAVAYLMERGVTKESITTFELGFAPSKNELLAFFARKKTPATVGQAVGLLSQSSQDRRLYDRFRDRIMFPIWNPQGDVVGFTGRIFLPGGDAGKYAKYMNSPESEVFHKSRVLYGYHLARKAIMNEKKVVLVEGQFDVVLSHQAGIQHCVGISGTALSDSQVGLLKRFADEVVVVLDADRAGIAAAEKTALAAYRAGMGVKAVKLPPGQDPADVISQDEKTWQELVAKPLSFVTYRLSLDDMQAMDPMARLKKVSTSLFPLISVMPSAVQQDLALHEIADALGVSMVAVRQDFERTTPAESRPVSETREADDALMRLVAPEQLLAGVWWWQEGSDDMKKHIQGTPLESVWDAVLSELEPERDALVFRAELLLGAKPERLTQNIESLVNAAVLKQLQKQFHSTLQSLKNYERSQNTTGMQEAQQAAQQLGQQIQDVKSRLHAL